MWCIIKEGEGRSVRHLRGKVKGEAVLWLVVVLLFVFCIESKAAWSLTKWVWLLVLTRKLWIFITFPPGFCHSCSWLNHKPQPHDHLCWLIKALTLKQLTVGASEVLWWKACPNQRITRNWCHAFKASAYLWWWPGFWHSKYRWPSVVTLYLGPCWV